MRRLLLATIAATALLGLGAAPASAATLSLEPEGAGSGLVEGLATLPGGEDQQIASCSWDGHTASGDCDEAIAPDTEVLLIASPDPGTAFAGWQDTCPGEVTGWICSFTVAASAGTIAVRPSFALERTLTVALAGQGQGLVTSDPPGLACAPSCTAAFAAGTQVTLTATPVPGSVFAGWSGACTGSATCTIDLDADRAVTATFAPASAAPVALSVTRAGGGSGTVLSDPAGIDCGTVCSAAFTPGTQVRLTATPAPGSVFAGWSGACTGSGACIVTLDEAQSVTATFEPAGIAAVIVSTRFTEGGPPGRRRVLRAVLRADERLVRVTLRLLRGGVVLASRHATGVGPATAALRLTIPNAVAGGRARLEVVFVASTGARTMATKRVRVPRL